ncbi:MAG: nucleotidyltransferase domain-containing protein, partial [Candidatus Omnitrophica bacterium]|nr:nucleotidyltransferase domain-containing protein [Candidatus Omnitrophota bacterium]
MKKNIEKIIEILKEYFQERHPEIEVAYIFGSIAQETTNALSDIDIGLILNKEKINERLYRYGYKAEFLTDLIKVLKTNNVDLVFLNEANSLLKHKVLYFGKLIYSKNEKKRIQFQIDTINKYNDFRQLIK